MKLNLEFHIYSIIVPGHCRRLSRTEINPVGVDAAAAGPHHGPAVAAGARPSFGSVVVIGGCSRKSAGHSAHIYTQVVQRDFIPEIQK